MIWSRICSCTVALSIGTSTSIRRSKLRGIQSADEIKTRAFAEGKPYPAPKQTMRECSRKTADDAFDTDVVGQSRQAGPQAAHPANDEVNGDARLRGNIEGVDCLWIDQRVQLRPNRRGPPGAGMFRLFFDAAH